MFTEVEKVFCTVKYGQKPYVSCHKIHKRKIIRIFVKSQFNSLLILNYLAHVFGHEKFLNFVWDTYISNLHTGMKMLWLTSCGWGSRRTKGFDHFKLLRTHHTREFIKIVLIIEIVPMCWYWKLSCQDFPFICRSSLRYSHVKHKRKISFSW